MLGNLLKKYLGIAIIDRYIIRKFLGTFFFALIIIIGIAIVFDLSEKMDDFLKKDAPLSAIIFKYYMNFIPYFAVLFSSLFTFIAVIFFTSKMAYNTEIIAILNSGMSFNRMLRPYFISAFILAVFSFLLNSYIIPPANRVRLQFEEKYIRDNPYTYRAQDVHKQISPGVFVYFKSYNNNANIADEFSMEKFENGKLVSKLLSDYVQWDSTINKWTVHNYYIRTINGLHETISKGTMLDTTLNMDPAEFKRRENFIEAMNLTELNRYIKRQRMQGAENIETSIVERDKRIAFPFSSFILTIIGVSLSSRKVKGGIGVQIGLGILLSFTYILFLQFTSQFAISGTLNSMLAAWLPNIIFSVVAFVLYRLAPK